MTRFSRYFDTVNYTESDYAEVQNRLLPEGVIRGVGAELQVTAPGGKLVRIATGEGMIQGFWFKNDANYDILVPDNNMGSVRTDAVYLTLDRTGNAVSLSVATNVSVSPAPTRQTGGTWQMLLATITVPNNFAALPPEAITDQRQGVYCGYTGGGDAPDGNVSSPGMAFAGRRSTGWWRDTPAGDPGGVRLSINAGTYYCLDYYGLSVCTGNVVPGGYTFHTHGGYWLQTTADAPVSYVMGNNIALASQTKQAIFGLGVAASQFLGGSGDLNIYTSGAASGGLILGTNLTRRMTIAPTTGAVTVGPVAAAGPTAPGKLNVLQTAHGANSGIKLFHANQLHHLDFFQDASAHVWMQNVNDTGVRAPNSLIMHVNTGYVTVGASVDALGKFTILQASESADQGIAIRGATGGYYRGYIVNEGSLIQVTATTGTRHWHTLNAFTPTSSDTTSLGLSNYRWSDVRAARGTIGGVDLTGGGADPISPDAYHLGGTNRWHTLRVYLINVGSHISVPFVYIDQTGGAPGYGLRFVFGSATSYIYSDGNNLNFWGHGVTARAHVMLVGDQAVFRPANDQGVHLGQSGGRWANLWCLAITSTTISCGAITCTTITTANNAINAGSGTLTVGTINASGAVNAIGGGKFQADITPWTDSNYGVGNNSLRWGAVYAYNGYKQTAGDWNAFPSDDRAKVLDAFRPYEPGLAVILKLRPTHYTLNGLYGGTEGAECVGFRAQELQEIAPDLVFSLPARAHPDREDEPEEDVLGVDTSNITYMTINAIQELHARIEALETALAERRN
jgi:hypothetical protein